MSTVSFFLPVRKGSQRVINKNTRTFAGIEGGILALKLDQLLSCKLVDEIILSTNDEVSIEIARQKNAGEGRIRIIERPEELCLDTTSLTDLIRYVPGIIHGDHILWGHVTTPFVQACDYDEGIKAYFEALETGYDSLVGVNAFQNFLLTTEGEVFNNSGTERWPRTQDLPRLFEINHSMFIADKKIYEKNDNRVGKKPFLYEMSKLKSLDIDWEEDFKIAEAVYEKLY